MHRAQTVRLCFATVMAVMAAVVVAATSCSQSGRAAAGLDASQGTGGTAGTGVATASGGGTGAGTGGAFGMGGGGATGNRTATGGGMGMGGASATGGAMATGGTTATGGAGAASANGGPFDSGTDGGATDGNSGDGNGSRGIPATGPIVGTPLATFDSNVSGFGLNTFVEVGNLAIATPRATLTWISTDGSPNPGCVKIVAPFSGPNEWVDLEAAAFSAPLPNWSGRTLHVRIKLDPSSTFSGFARLYVKTGTGFVFYTTAFTPYPQAAGWQEFVLPLVSPAPVPPANPGADPVQIATFGIDPITGGSPPTTPTPVTFYVDSFSIE